MTDYPLTQWPILSAVLLVLVVVVWLVRRQAAHQDERMAAQMKTMREMMTLFGAQPTGPANGSADATGAHAVGCATTCRSEVLEAVKGIEQKMTDGFDDVRREFRSHWKAIAEHRERLAVLEDRASVRRRKAEEADSDRPGR